MLKPKQAIWKRTASDDTNFDIWYRTAKIGARAMTEKDDPRRTLTAYFMARPDVTGLPDEAVIQAKWQAQLRLETLKSYPAFDLADGARLLGTDKNSALTTWRKWEREGRLFSIAQNDERLYPAFQFNLETGEPLLVIQQVLSVFHPEDVNKGWPVYLWFTHSRPALRDRIPANLLSTEPQAVINAAVDDVQPIDG